MSSGHSFVRGAMLLAGAAILTKLLGSVYTIVLQNIIGDHGMGLFQMAYPIYATLLAMATAGFPVAISKLVSERLALSDNRGVTQIFHVALLLLSVLGAASFAILFFGARFWAEIAGDPAATWAIRAISPALLIVPVLSALRGYFQGYQWMEPTASSQVMEQFVRVATILGLAVWLVSQGYGKEIAAAGAAFGAVTGALSGLILLLFYWRRRHPDRNAGEAAHQVKTSTLVRQLIYYAFPISLGALVVPLMNNIDVVTVVNLLKHTGDAQGAATTEFGLLSGRASKLMMLPTTLAAGIGIAVMPAVSEAFTLGYRRLMNERIDMAVRLTVMLALPAAAGLALLAGPVDVALFKDTAGADTIRIMAYATVFASLQTTLAAVLQGSGSVYLPVYNLLIACVVKAIGNIMLVPAYGIRGAATATVISYGVAAALNLSGMNRRIETKTLWLRWFGKPLLATLIMSGFVYALLRQWSTWHPFVGHRLEAGLACLVLILIGIIIYGAALLASSAVVERELRQVPRVGDGIANLCIKLGLVKREV
ncbi:putative polysaccharide biosynthesis protein [Alicyclobacillus ferrooxydans]|uniref:Uncharacterized protein n=1 Tax=Alicyclobacillus ferrooxydans TaxID=471514 RepID=A0A0P9EZY4_9BACL|nr:polysaccharide biosynthesis protein [Alicyclobacillus ferrooxydans]KPV44652.1 hypothetical protein AN477_06685 [Alicyclobacillus ferrooxydans]